MPEKPDTPNTGKPEAGMPNVFKKLYIWWKHDAKVRFYARTFGVAIASYIYQSFQSDAVFTWAGLGAAAGTAAITAALGLLGLEPKVGIKAKVTD